MSARSYFDGVLIIGAGLAGLSAALAAAPRRALVLSAAPLGTGCSSAWAQGGMAAALTGGDAPELHAADTLAAGAGICDPEAVAILTREGPDAVRRLAALGAPFDRTEDGGFVQSLEAAHGRPRVARVGGDGAGRAIMQAVIAAVRAEPRIEVREGVRARRLLTDRFGRVRGALVEDADGALAEIVAPATILATGGLGGLVQRSAMRRGVVHVIAALHRERQVVAQSCRDIARPRSHCDDSRLCLHRPVLRHHTPRRLQRGGVAKQHLSAQPLEQLRIRHHESIRIANRIRIGIAHSTYQRVAQRGLGGLQRRGIERFMPHAVFALPALRIGKRGLHGARGAKHLHPAVRAQQRLRARLVDQSAMLRHAVFDQRGIRASNGGVPVSA
jgi:hypothetical protein